MTDQGNALQRLVQSRMDELGITSARELTRRAQGRVSYEPLRRMLMGTYDAHMSDELAEGVAAALSLPVAKVREAADMPRSYGPWAWPKRFEVLDMADRRSVEDLVARLVDARSKG